MKALKVKKYLSNFFIAKGYRDDSLETVKENSRFYNLPLTILSFKDLYGFTMDEISILN